MKETENEIIYGYHPVVEALERDMAIDKLFIQQGLKPEHFKTINRLTHEKAIPYQMVPKEKLNRLTKGNHQGLVALVSAIAFASLDQVLEQAALKGEMPFLLYLDRVTDVRNFGAICRTALAAGVHAVIVPARGSAQIGADAMKTSAGALAGLPVVRWFQPEVSLLSLKEYGIEIVAISEKSSLSLFKAQLLKPLCLIMGAESEGISPALMKISDQKCFIPMQSSISSLNVSVAAAIAIYEALRQRITLA